jgi:integrase
MEQALPPARRAAANRAELTDLALRRLVAAGKAAVAAKAEPKPRYTIWDTRVEHLAARVHSNGKVVWYFIYRLRPHKQPFWFRIGRFPAIGVEDARKRARGLNVEIDEERHPQAERQFRRQEETCESLLPQYVAHRKASPRGKSVDQTERLLRRHVMPSFGKYQPSQIGDVMVTKLLSAYEGKNPMYNAVRNAWLSFQTWTKDTHRAKKTGTRERWLDDPEIAVWWAELEASGVNGKALQVLLLTGQRPIEIARMRTEHIEGEWWTLPGQPDREKRWPGVKNERDHMVYLPQAARDIIAGLGTTGFVFQAEQGGPVYKLDETMREISARLEKKHKATKPHDLRTTHGSHVTKLRFSLELMDRIQNHKIPGVGEKHYNMHDYKEEKAEAMVAVADKFMKLIAKAK